MKTVYVTGASAGLGRAIAEAYAAAGYTLGLIARDEQALAETAISLPVKTAYATADVSDYNQLKSAADKLASEIGPPDIWINNAMATIFSRFEDIAPEEFARSINVTLLGSMHGIRIALGFMKPRRQGQIIQIGSALAYRAIPLQAPYCAAKHALRAAIDSLRCELIYDRSPITVTMVHMPGMNTPQFDWARRHINYTQQPVPPVYAPQACAQAVLWTAKHPNRREVWVGRSTWEAIIGNKFFPALMDYYMVRCAYKGQFDQRSDITNTEGNLFQPLHRFHRTEGRFSQGQRTKVLWVSSSWQHEVAMIGFAVLFIAILLISICRA